MLEAENRIPQEEISKELPKSTSLETTGREIPTGNSAENLDKQGSGTSVEALNQAIDQARAAGYFEKKYQSGGEKRPIKPGEIEAFQEIRLLAQKAGKPKIFKEFDTALFLEDAGLNDDEVIKARYEAIGNAIVNGDDQDAFDCLFTEKYDGHEIKTFDDLLNQIESTGSIKYLIGEGDDDLAYAKQLEGPARNSALRNSIKLELTDEDSQFSKFSSKSTGMVRSGVLARMLAMEDSKLAELVKGEIRKKIDSRVRELDRKEYDLISSKLEAERVMTPREDWAIDSYERAARKKYREIKQELPDVRKRKENLLKAVL
ncbi:MAG TPA: hypothetical protein PKY08_00960 [Candidatus Magasanikbacteria bacterium]|nr:hypothetical protein [Candidatus Magasanikbacteria bacterium]